MLTFFMDDPVAVPATSAVVEHFKQKDHPPVCTDKDSGEDVVVLTMRAQWYRPDFFSKVFWGIHGRAVHHYPYNMFTPLAYTANDTKPDVIKN